MAYNTSKIIGTADATHYLVVLTAGSKTDRHVRSFDSISDAKQFLRDQHFDSTVIEFQTPYDEMCGMASAPPYIEHIKLWAFSSAKSNDF